MHNDRTAKLRRRAVALANLKKNQQNWKDVKSCGAAVQLLSCKAKRRIAEQYDSPEFDFAAVRKAKLAYIERQIETLEKRV